ncbi:alpha-glucan phosphorylase [Thiohalobacter thiocyanaticus]|uniref:Alpha-glucan phosphorylase n=1 Tax=Thiohalobacter thiocyanaticus TaxID=585455 RepID=A0A1Z4VTG6_9GAMM|nr:alpha-glucan family phosphorylase [Thiohalobacter thiocyanaticus]BAZ94793.1 alpha-glucan phosphorylase [Thiohalobacter thiocyanaticus]
MPREFLNTERIAYLTMEVALRPDIPTYSGGLGVLAGDTVRSAADLELPLVTVSLASRKGYFRQRLDANGRQQEEADPWEPSERARPLQARVVVPIEGRDVWVGGWLYVLEGGLGGRQPVILLDTDLGENSADDCELTHYLYGGDAAYRLKQEIVLGIGGARMLHALGFRVRQYHMNEGHAALLCLELMNRYAYPNDDLRPGETPYDIPRVRDLCNFTTHTPVEAGHDKFPYDLVDRVLGDFIDRQTLRRLAGEDQLNMTRLALNSSDYVNGVARRHAETSQHLFPGYHVRYVTNGVHPQTWTHVAFAGLYDRSLPGWSHEPELLVRADCCLSDEAVWQAHQAARRDLVALVRDRTGIGLDPEAFTLGFARRMTAYKRPELLFSDIARLKAIAGNHPLQIVMAGKAHPRDEEGKRAIEAIHAHMHELAGVIQTAYIPNYDMAVAATLVAGVDVWLNTPLPPWEASGTSGMKAAFNGVPHLSVLDGWWSEGRIEGVTGWAIGNGDADGDDATHLYEKLDQVVLPLFYQDRAGWLRLMKNVIAKNASYFNSHRMMRRYASDAYIR